jgi:hypothetical protein
MDGIKRQRNTDQIKGGTDAWRAHATCRASSARNLGIVSIFSARRSVT